LKLFELDDLEWNCFKTTGRHYFVYILHIKVTHRTKMCRCGHLERAKHFLILRHWLKMLPHWLLRCNMFC